MNKHRLSPLLILTHDYPDPDSLASAYALHHLAERDFGIRSKITYGGVIGRMENREMVKTLRLPVHKLRASDLRVYRHVAIVDTQPSFQNNSFPKNRKATIVIDQHPSATRPSAEMAVVDTHCGATSVILAQVLLSRNVEIPRRVATALVYGILSDTLNLYRVERAEIVSTYLRLLPVCNMRALARIQNPSRPRTFFVTLVKAIRKAEVRRGLILSHLGFVENPDLVSQTADFLLTYRGMQWSFCTGRYRGNLHVSLRLARSNGAAGGILRDIFVGRGQAGGHGRIAGGKLRVGESDDEQLWEAVERSLTHRLLKRLRIPAGSRFSTPFQVSA